MNRNAKGAIAVGAGALLLLGGGGTFALWNATSELGDSVVTAGELSLDDTAATGTWHLYDSTLGYPAGVGSAIADLTTFNIEPGTSIIYVVDDLEVTAEGSNLYYVFESDLGAEDGSDGGYTTSVVTESGDLPGSAVTTGDFTSTVTGAFTATTNRPVYHYASATPETATFAAGLVVEFDADAQDSFWSELDLDGFNFVLAQVLADN